MDAQIEEHYKKSMQLIRDGCYEIAHTHPENILFFNAYPLSDEGVAEEVLQLKSEDTQGRPSPEHQPERYGEGLCMEYVITKRRLENKHGDTQEMTLYIKLKLSPDIQNANACKILSFHLSEGTQPAQPVTIQD